MGGRKSTPANRYIFQGGLMVKNSQQRKPVSDAKMPFHARGAIITRIRALAACMLLHTGLAVPGLIFGASGPVRIPFNLEVGFLFALWAGAGTRWGNGGLRRFAAGAGIFYVLALVYQTYAGILGGMYRMEPNFYNDFSFIAGNLLFLLEAMNLPVWVYPAGAALVAGLVCLAFWGMRTTFSGVPVVALGRGVRFGLVALGLLAALAAYLQSGRSEDFPVPVSSTTADMAANIRHSFEARADLIAYPAKDPARAYDYTRHTLSGKPDVYFLFIESYGSVLYQQDRFLSPYLEMMGTLEKNLAEDGWTAVSALSEAPVWGGGSWMAYTSAMFGISIDRQIEYDVLKEKYAVLEYPNIGRYFSSQGYEYVWVEPINRQLTESSAAVEQAFYGPDKRITFETLNYDGPLLGWGPSVPDQFTLGYIGEYAGLQEPPVFMVFLTQNLHYPWVPLIPLLDDWRALQTFDLQSSALSEAQVKGSSWDEKYLLALENTLDSLVTFITALENENSVIVLIGDHQPPQVSRQADGFGTMVHIIAQNDGLLDSFQDYGFEDGLVLQNTIPVMQHEGLYSLFIRNFVGQYGRAPRDLPAYLPDGVQ